MRPAVRNMLENISLIVTPISFIASLITLYLSARIKERISNAVDRNHLSKSIFDISSEIDQLINKFENNPDHLDFSKTRRLLVEIQAEYPFIEKSLKKLINEAIQISSISKDMPIQENLPIKLSNLLINIKSNLRKEVEYYE